MNRLAGQNDMKAGQGLAEACEIIRKELHRLARQPSKKKEASEKIFRIYRLEAALNPIDLLDWLSQQKNPARFFWKDRNGITSQAGVGLAWDIAADSWEDDQTVWDELSLLVGADPGLRVFTGMSFHKAVSGHEWDSFKGIRFFIPRFELVSTAESFRLICNIVIRQGERFPLRCLLDEMDGLCFQEVISSQAFTFKSRENLPNFEDWKVLVRQILAGIQSSHFGKVVLARRSTFVIDPPPDPCCILKGLMADHVGTSFLFQFEPGHAFFGLTPELFYSRSLNDLRSEAIAGTRPRGATRHEDECLAQELLDSDKDHREHAMVVSALLQNFRCLCRTYALGDAASVLKLSRQQHLISAVSGKLSSGIDDRRICVTLHPTPAVGGTPTDAALRYLQEHEPFDRGWFSGPVGYLSRDYTELAVAIRSCLTQDDRYHLYSGAGIVDGSDPSSEWDETEFKITQYMDVLNGC